MSKQPAVGTTKGGAKGTAAQIAALKSAVKRLESTPVKIAPGSTGGTIAPGSINTGHIVATGLTAAAIAVGVINATHIQSFSITANQIQANTITAGQIAVGSLTADTIQANAITAGKIATNSLEARHIQAGVIAAVHISAGSIDASHIQANSIDALAIRANIINAGHIQAGSLTATTIAANTIVAGNIAAGAITTATLAASAVTTVTLAADAITAEKISAGAITATKLAAGSVTAGSIEAGAITAGSIAANAVTAGTIAANAVVAGSVAADAITGREIFGTTLSAITSDMGSINAGTITGGTIQTSAAGARVVLSSSGLIGYALNGTTKVFEINAGTGAASFTGVALLDPASTVPSRSLTGFIGGGNILSDASFESTDPATPNSLWTGFGVTVARSAVQAFHGTKSLAVTYASGSDPFAYIYTSNAVFDVGTAVRLRNKPIVFSAWVYVPAATKATAITGRPDRTLLIADGVGSAETTITNLPADTWTRVVLKHTVNAACTNLDFRLYNPYATGPVYYDGVQIEVGDAATAFNPRADEIIYGSIRSEFIGAGQIKTNNLEAGAVKAGNISVSFGGANQVKNARMAYWPSGDIAFEFGSYNNGANAGTYSKVAGGGPNGENSQRLAITTKGTQFGILTGSLIQFRAGATYVLSFYYKGPVAPLVQSNGDHETPIWIDNPPPSTTAWQRYSQKRKYTLSRGDQIYLDTSGVGTAEWANIQLEEAEIPGAFAPKPDEILPESVGNTQITPNSITADKIIAVTLAAVRANIGTLSSITANIGDVTVGTLTGVTITGSTVRTATGGARVELNSGGLIGYNSGGSPVVTISSGDGSFTATGGTITGAVVRTSAGNPRVQLDSSGFRSTDGGGTPVVTIDTVNGLSMLQGTGNTNKVTWHDSANAQVAELGGYLDQNGRTYAELTCPRSVGGSYRGALLVSQTGTFAEARISAYGSPSDYASVETSYTSGFGIVRALALPKNKLVIDSAGNSDFVYQDINRAFKVERNYNIGNSNADLAQLEIIASGFQDDDRPRLAFLIPGVVRNQIHLTSSGNFQCVNDPNTAYVNLLANFVAPSDRRLKENFKELDCQDALDKVSRMDFYRFDWKETDRKGIGPTAQDFHKAFPGLEGDSDNPDGKLEDLGDCMAYPISDAIGVCLASIKYLSQEIERLKARLLLD